MKKILLFTVLFAFNTMLFAQLSTFDKYRATKMPYNNSYYKTDKLVLPSLGPVKTKNYLFTKDITTLSKIPFASSFNIFTAIVSNSNCLTYEPGINTIMFTHRAGGPYGGNGNQVTFSFTSDLGTSFKNITVDNSSYWLRYPSGVIFNPHSNTNPDNAYALCMGPSIGGSNWDSYYYAYSKLDSTDITFNAYPDNSGIFPQYFPRIGFASCDDSTQHIMGYFDDGAHADGAHNIKYLAMNNFKYEDAGKGGFQWTTSKVSVPLFNAPTDGIDVYSGINTAWSQDGSIGYMWIIGVDSLDPNMATVPIIFKSTDKGNSWTAMPYFDFTTNTTIMSHLNDWWQFNLGYTGTPRVNFIDWYSGSDAVVDANGDLHIFTLVGCGFGITKDPDSLGYIYVYEPKIIYDVYTTPTGWDAWVVDTILTKYVPAAQSGFGSGNDAVGWDHRIQACRTNDGTKLFCVWNDSDTTFTDMVSIPDVLARGYDINTGYKTPVINFTANTNFDGDNYFMYVADRVIVQGNDYIIPVVTADIGSTPDDPPTYELLTGITFNETDFTSGIKTYSDDNAIVYQNYPNPFKEFTNIDINLKKTANVNISVRNMMGQEVMYINAGNLTTGTHTLKIDGRNLTSGIYFYNISIGTNCITGKMIVK